MTNPTNILSRLMMMMMSPLLIIMTLLLFMTPTFAYPGMVKQADTDSRPRLYRAKELVNIMKELRAGDYRLVRPSSPTAETQVEQHRWCPYKLHSFVMTTCTSTAAGRSRGKMSVSLHKRGLAAEAVALCLTEQPQFRDMAANTSFFHTNLTQIQQHQLVGWSLAEGLTVLLQEGLTHYQEYRDGGAVIAMAQAAEAVWIASFHHPTLIQSFLQHHTIQILGDLIVSLRPNFDKNNSSAGVEYPYHPAHAVMWACAALQNLAAHYCDNELGYCIWEWQQQDDTTGESKLTLDHDTAVVRPELAQQARQQIADVPNLLETLRHWICHVGHIHAPVNQTYGWPSEAILWKDLTFNAQSPHLQSPSIVPWAAAGLIKNLLLGKDNIALQEQLSQLSELPDCLCRMAQNSPDWLEHGKAAAAVHFGGMPCSSDKHCRDDETWHHAESGETCQDYARERWCVEYGDDVNEHGTTARQACCACGGGIVMSGDNNQNENIENDNGQEQEWSMGENVVMGKTTGEMVETAEESFHEEL
ncbi:expressed unknown protein [Seminavis robusta]|uniref:Uncharacterized protein n=1 Tax=Seminavis robusta TaxID=568900 RepID=A0A9N8EYV2_9STRA|nr:expressed unknown protein [Seminavis robusta]|eukprot:Sro2011_g310860.1 n/a (530) ;mRNA; r:3245-4834